MELQLPGKETCYQSVAGIVAQTEGLLCQLLRRARAHVHRHGNRWWKRSFAHIRLQPLDPYVEDFVGIAASSTLALEAVGTGTAGTADHAAGAADAGLAIVIPAESW